MLKRLVRRFRGVLPYADLLARAVVVINALLDRAEGTDLESLKRHPDWYRAWAESLRDTIRDIASSDTRSQQLAKTRAAMVDALQHDINSQPMFWANWTENWTEGDMQKAISLLGTGSTPQETRAYAFAIHVDSIASIACLGDIARHLGDLKQPSWFAFYSDTYRLLVEQLLRSRFAEHEGTVYELQPFLPHLKDSVDQLRTRVINGDDLEYEHEQRAQPRELVR